MSCISNTGEAFTEEGLDFSNQKTVGGLPLSLSYVNSMGTWAYTMKCPVIKDTYLMDAVSERLVLKPRGMGERDAGHMNLDDFYFANKILKEDIYDSVADSIKNGKDIMFYHDVLNKNSLIYMWSVNGGTVYLIGYMPVRAIQREGNAVNQNIFIVVAVMLAAFLGCCALYLFFERQQNKIRKDREVEREILNNQLREALQAAQIASNSKTSFLSNMSHDIRTPMNAILGFATLLAKDAEQEI